MKYLLNESELPRRWYNIAADMPSPAQPESYRQLRALVGHHQQLQAADDHFREEFAVDDSEAAATRARCWQCGWQREGPLMDVREEALVHLESAHAPRARQRC
jgi:hypothetical protein